MSMLFLIKISGFYDSTLNKLTLIVLYSCFIGGAEHPGINRPNGKRKKGRELPTEPQYSNHRKVLPRDIGYKNNLRDCREPREYSELRDPRNSHRMLPDFPQYGSLDIKKYNKWKSSEVVDVDFNGLSTEKMSLRETKIYGDDRDFEVEDAKYQAMLFKRRIQSSSHRDISDHERELIKLGIIKSNYDLECDRRDLYDTKNIERKLNNFRKPNDSLTDLSNQELLEYYQRSNASSRLSRRDIQDRIELEKLILSSQNRRLRDTLLYNRHSFKHFDYSSKSPNIDRFKERYPPMSDYSYHHSLPRTDNFRKNKFSNYHKGFGNSPRYFNSDQTDNDFEKLASQRFKDDHENSANDEDHDRKDRVVPRVRLNDKVSYYLCIDDLLLPVLFVNNIAVDYNYTSKILFYCSECYLKYIYVCVCVCVYNSYEYEVLRI